ncbi:MAG: hypothetical protein HQM08_04540 [Candidatus Riflebacteria bacterium]|nr:hypothetical protein [Candidatus Riflebacteria bacterium]
MTLLIGLIFLKKINLPSDMMTVKKIKTFLLLVFFSVCFCTSFLSVTKAFNEQNIILINVILPAIKAGYETHKHGGNVGSAILQAIAGGLVLQKGLKIAGDCNQNDDWEAWRAKILVNVGTSLMESAGKEKFRFRMDMGPVWVSTGEGGLKFQLGIHSTITSILNFHEGASFDLQRSLGFGTMCFSRPRNLDGTIGTKGTLAYSNGNNIITDFNGDHVGHEFVHSLQYRRDAWLVPSLGKFFNGFPEKLGKIWMDDTGWSVDWVAQSLLAGPLHLNKDFDIPMEKEAYYIADHWSN